MGEGTGGRRGLRGRGEGLIRLGDRLVGVVEQDPGPAFAALANLEMHDGLARYVPRSIMRCQKACWVNGLARQCRNIDKAAGSPRFHHSSQEAARATALGE